MNRNFRKLASGALMSGIGLWLAAVPADATPLLGFFTQTTEYGINPLGPVNASVFYNSVNGGPQNGPIGLTFTNNDPTASFSFSPNPSLAQGGLGAGAVGITGAGVSSQLSADVSTGTTHLYAATTEGSSVQSTSGALIEMVDQLTFVVTGNESTITMGFSLDGLLGLNAGAESSYNQEIRYSVGSADMEWDVQSDGTPPYTGNTQGFSSFAFTNTTITGFNFLGTFTVTNGETLQMVFTQNMNCNHGAVCDFSNTGQMALILPSDVTFTSTGGFLSGSAASAPEPGSMLLMGLGMTVIGFFGRRLNR